MKKLIIEGIKELKGTIDISGAKNSVVALIPASILCDNKATILNVPAISDTNNLLTILDTLNVKYKYKDEKLEVNTTNMKNINISEELSSKLRASYYFMGALIAKYKKATMYFPGGCKIGARPIDLHIKGFEKMGVKVTNEGDYYTFNAENLKGAKIYLDFASVGATINLMMAAVKAKGTTVISNAAKEPEIVNIATFLNTMGAKITGAGTSKIIIHGVESLDNGIIETIPDRIEAGTYIIAGALLGNELKINGIIKEHLDALISKLREMGVELEMGPDYVIVSKPEKYKPIKVKSLVFPGFVTDLGQPMQTILTQCSGTSTFEETIYESRMGHVPYLNKMGANITATSTTAKIKGPTALKGTTVVATDLRAGACLVLAGLIAEGTTVIEDAEHILRGYEKIDEKLNNVGAKIKIEE